MRSYSKLNQYIQEVCDWITGITACAMICINELPFSLQLVDSLNDPTHGYLVAEGFKTILCETEECLNFNCHANIRFLNVYHLVVRTFPY